MKKTIINSITLLTIISLTAFAQNIGINGTGNSAHPSALLDIDDAGGNNKGLLIPRIQLTAINNAAPVTAPLTSLLVYNTATVGAGTIAVTPGYYYWDGAKWVRLQTTQGWELTGNVGTNPAVNYIGTSDAQDLVIKTSNSERMRVTSGGNIGVGTTAPSTSLHIVATATNTGFQLQDGTEGAGKVLTSDASGKASWGTNSSINIIGTITSPFTLSTSYPTAVPLNDNLTIVQAGLYLVIYRLDFAGTNNTDYHIVLKKNGTLNIEDVVVASTPQASWGQSIIIKTSFFNASDVLAGYYYVSSGGMQKINGELIAIKLN